MCRSPAGGVPEQLLVFHDDGYAIYDPHYCYLEHQVTASFSNFAVTSIDPTSPLRLCDVDKPCTWGAAVNVGDKYAYVTQPSMDRVVVVSLEGTMNPVKVSADRYRASKTSLLQEA